MGNLTVGLIFVIVINLLAALSNLAVLDINPDSAYIYNEAGTLFKDFENSDVVLETSDSAIKSNYPEAAILEPSSGNPFTDTLSSIKNWFSDLKGLRYAKAILGGFYYMLKASTLPYSFVLLISAAWYALNAFILIAFFWGKD